MKVVMTEWLGGPRRESPRGPSCPAEGQQVSRPFQSLSQA